MGLRWRRARRRPRVVLVGVLGLMLSACGGNGATDPTPPPSAIPSTTDVRQPPLVLGSVVWTTGIDATTGEPVDRVETFPRDAVSIHAALEVGNLPAGSILTAAWEINGSPIEALESTITVDQARSLGWVEFRLDWVGEARWPVGTLTIRITANTGETVEGEARIG